MSGTLNEQERKEAQRRKAKEERVQNNIKRGEQARKDKEQDVGQLYNFMSTAAYDKSNKAVKLVQVMGELSNPELSKAKDLVKRTEFDNENVLEDLFIRAKDFDQHQHGKVTATGLQKLMEEILGPNTVSESEAEDMIRVANMDGDKLLDEDEFISVMLRGMPQSN